MLMNAPCPVVTPRRVKMPISDPVNPSTAPSANTPALAQFFKGSRDTMDYGIDFSDWLIANGNSQLKTAAFAAAADTPQAPTIASQTFSPTGEVVVLIEGGDPGDAYYLDCTVTVDVVQMRDGQAVPIGEREIVRRIHVVVYKN